MAVTFRLRWLLIPVVTVLAGCSPGLDMAALEAEIQTTIERQGRRLTLTRVQCPRNIPFQAGGHFRCVGELPTGGQFTINVTQRDDQGGLDWDVPNTAVLLNMGKVEESIRSGLAEAFSKRAVVDCGELYRINQPGEVFECRLVGGLDLDGDRIETVVVRIDSDGNLSWQEVRVAATAATGAATPRATAPGATAAPATTGGAAAAEASEATTPEAIGFESVPQGTAGSRQVPRPNFRGSDD